MQSDFLSDNGMVYVDGIFVLCFQLLNGNVISIHEQKQRYFYEILSLDYRSCEDSAKWSEQNTILKGSSESKKHTKLYYQYDTSGTAGNLQKLQSSSLVDTKSLAGGMQPCNYLVILIVSALGRQLVMRQG
eukprot:gb/GECG01012726.1/.p1 GENE.gb/GECG01012726.1/~~gb/GECG01012726.1/.p1  ORF type:complete len:131 (+),score=12.99 gb/GECG01012726.1/:1-393(+)